MKLGINLLLWTDDATDEQWLPLCERLAALGYDGVELPIFDPDPEAYAKLGRRLDALGLERTAVAICRPETDPISPDARVRDAARATGDGLGPRARWGPVARVGRRPGGRRGAASVRPDPEPGRRRVGHAPARARGGGAGAPARL